MGQKVNPVLVFRLGMSSRGWDSNWYGGKDLPKYKLVEDQEDQELCSMHRIPKGGISKVIIERTIKRITLTMYIQQGLVS